MKTENFEQTAVWDWEEARRRCLGLAMNLLRCVDDAEDAVQEALIRGFRNSESCRNQNSHISWLLTITRRECARLARRRAERDAAAFDSSGEHSSNHDISKAVASAVDLHAAMEHLAVEDRALLSLHHVQHFTQAEIAQIAGLPEGTVKTRLHRSRVRLRSKMEVK